MKRAAARRQEAPPRARDLTPELQTPKALCDFARMAADYHLANFAALSRDYRRGKRPVEPRPGHPNHTAIRWRADVVYFAEFLDSLTFTNRDFSPTGRPYYASGNEGQCCIPWSKVEWPATWPRYFDSRTWPKACGLPRVSTLGNVHMVTLFDDKCAPWSSEKYARSYRDAVHVLCDFIEAQQVRRAA